MAQSRFINRLQAIHWDPAHWARMSLQTFGKALTRLWSRAVMLYVGRLSFLRVLGEAFEFRPLRGASWLYSEWTWASAGMTLGMSLIYRWAMSRRPVAWRASILGGASAAVLCLFASWATAYYVTEIAHLGAT